MVPFPDLVMPNSRPPLKWAGGKRWLVPHIKHIWAQHSGRRLVEPFCGGLAVALGLAPSRALLNDINPHLISFYEWLQRGFHINIPMENDSEMYYAHRERFNRLTADQEFNSHESAELFYFLNRTGFNGLCRFSQKGVFNVPFGKYKTINYQRDFTSYQAIFSRWKFTTGSFDLVPVDSNDFIYADPPYDVEFTSYAKEGFSWHDQVRLAEWLAKHPGPVVLSNQATPRVIDLYQKLGFSLKHLQAPRMISATGNRSRAGEVLAVRGINPHLIETLGGLPASLSG